MKILVVTNLFFPDRGGGASVFSDLCFGLAERGHQVTVFTTYPYYPEWRRKSDDNPWRVRRETLHGVDVRRYGLYVPSKPGGLVSRVLLEGSFLASLLRSLARFERYDAVVAYCPLASAVAYAGVRRLLAGEPLWLNVQDIPADAAAASGISRSRFFNRFADWVQRQLFRRADCITSISPSMLTRCQEIAAPTRRAELFPNFLNGSLADEVHKLPSKLGRPAADPIRLLYAGNIGAKQGLREFCEQLQRSEIPFQFTIHGDGGAAGQVREFIEQSGDSRFRFGPFLDEAGFAQALHASDLFVITEKQGIGASFIPSKLIPCIATGTPILAICDRESPLGQELSEWNLGVNLPWSRQADLPERLARLTADPAELAQLQQNCLDRARHYGRDAALDHAEEILEALRSHLRGEAKHPVETA